VAACVWDHAGGQGPLSLFWRRRASLIPAWRMSRSLRVPAFEEWWEPFTLGVGPAGSYAAGLDAKRQAQLREPCRAMLPAAPFVLTARAWAARGLV